MLIDCGVDVNEYDWVRILSHVHWTWFSIIWQQKLYDITEIFNSFCAGGLMLFYQMKPCGGVSLFGLLWCSFCGFQNGGAPLLYAVHGNHVRCVEILLGEDKSLWSEISIRINISWRINIAGLMPNIKCTIIKFWYVFQRVVLILPLSQILDSMQWTWLWLWVTGMVCVN